MERAEWLTRTHWACPEPALYSFGDLARIFNLRHPKCDHVLSSEGVTGEACAVTSDTSSLVQGSIALQTSGFATGIPNVQCGASVRL